MRSFIYLLLLSFLSLNQPMAYAESKQIDNGILTTIHKNTHTNEENIDYELSYPYFTNTPLNTVENNFNTIIQDIVDTETGNFRAIVNEANGETDPSKEPYKTPSTLRMNYDVVLLSGKSQPLLSILFTLDSFVAGSEHPNTTHRVLNFDFKSGEAIAIAELFKAKIDFVTPLNHYVAKQLQQKHKINKTENEMIANNEINYAQWNITKDGLLVTLDEFPHVLGIQQVLIPYSEMTSLLSKTGPVARCLQDNMTLNC